MKAARKYIAFDIGASNGRCVIGSFDGRRLSLDVLSRFENGYVRVHDHLYWNVLGLWNNVKLSLARAASDFRGQIAAVGVDTWGNDFGLLDKHGELIGSPHCYRDPEMQGMMAEAFKIIPREEMFQITGIQFMEINGLYHLMAMVRSGSPMMQIAETFLMMPDLLNYWLTGRKVCEYTNATTPQVLDARTRQWAYPLIGKLGIPEHIFPEIIDPGQVLSPITHLIRDETGLSDTPVIAVATHDTAAAVAAVPASGDNFAYLSSGTWGLLGAEIPGPLLDLKVMQYNFGNEGGVFSTIRLLRNIANMWLVQECERIWALEGDKYTWDQLSSMAEQARPFTGFVDPDDPAFLLPDHMPSEIQRVCADTGQSAPQTRGEIIRACLESLAMKYRYNFEKLVDLLGKVPEVFHIVGGASRNRLLNQFTANAIKQPVIAGPSEATALGNVIMQMIAVGDLADLAEARQLIRDSFPTETFTPQDTATWDEQYAVFLSKTGLPPIPVRR